jgi:nuclear factor related to kappa-B-binding protein
MLLPDRPPHVTILCLVRDAASRLPGRTGTRADVCTLLKDSQYLNHAESNKEPAVNQVVSGALDRLHYERDPCVLYDNDKKLWTYLHRGRDEEDFEDDGTSSTKKWKRPRKDSLDPSEAGAGNDDLEDDGTPNAKKQKKDDADPTASGEDKDGVDHAMQDPGLEDYLDLDVVPSSTNNEETGKPVSTDVKPDIGISRPSVGATAGNTANDNSARIPEQFYSMALPVDSTSKDFNNA